MTRRFLPLLAIFVPALHAQDGQQLFTQYCSACHGADGKGATGGTFPPLAGSPWLAGAPDRAVKIVLKGLTGPVEVLGKPFNLEMPPQGETLTDDQLASILTYVRSAWGNQGSAVTPEFVKTTRAALTNHNAPWTAPEILKLHPLPLGKPALSKLIFQVYATDAKEIPDFSKLKTVKAEEERDNILNIDKSPLDDHFVMVWDGDFEAPTDGVFGFTLDADDAANVTIDGNKIVEIKGIGPVNGSRRKTGKITLNKGNHKFHAEYLQFSDRRSFALTYTYPPAKDMKWLTKHRVAKPRPVYPPIPVEPENGRTVIYRNFIKGTTPRAIGVGFPGGVNIAYSADNLAPELLWTGEFINGAHKWLGLGIAENPPAGKNLVSPTKSPALPKEARFKGYQLDPTGNPTFMIQIGTETLLDSWHGETNALVRKLTLTGNGSSVQILIAEQPIDKRIDLKIEGATLDIANGKTTLKLASGKPVTLTYHWK